MLATLLTNEKMAKDLEALISNMREHGVLFYRDSARRAEERAVRERPQQAPPAPTPRPRGRR